MKSNYLKKKYAYLFFHLNLFFSSLPKNKRKDVINKCYWPLLNLINESGFLIGIEITGWTLNEIKKIDKRWIVFFKKLLKENKTYLIGSSYTQTIFPIIPNEVNIFNIKYGNQIYKKILNQIPKIAYVNEQCFSRSVVDLYKKNNYHTLIIDWDSIKNNKNIKPVYQFYPQKLQGNKSVINVIWNSSNNFQNFQKNVHSKLSDSEYFNIFDKINNYKDGIVSIYGSDAEIFDFRLKRFENETKIQNHDLSEWQKIKNLLIEFEKKFTFVNLYQINKICLKSKFNNKLINITNMGNIISTKKQMKYNILRWCVGGQNNFKINTFSWRFYLKKNKTINNLKKLCYFWSSDFRTYIEKNRWKKLSLIIEKESIKINSKNLIFRIFNQKNLIVNVRKKIDYLEEDNDFINYDDGKYFFKLDKKRGLTLKSFGLIKNRMYRPYLKNYHQGYFSNDKLNVDLYTGHNVVENYNSKYSDLDNQGDIRVEKKNNFLVLSNNFFKKQKVDFSKKWYFDLRDKTLYLHNKIKIFDINFLTVRSNYFNLNDDNFNIKKLKITMKNGGSGREKFFLKDSENFFHDDPISPKCTAKNCFGNTDGVINFRENKKLISFKIFNEIGACSPMMCFQRDKDKKYFLRFLTTFKENNDIKSNSCNNFYESLISVKIK